MKAQELNQRQMRWALYLSRFNFILKHVPRSKMEKVDSLNRRLDQKIRMKKDNKDQMLVKLKWLEMRRAKAVEIIVNGVDLLEEIRKSKVKDDKVVKVVEEMKRARAKMLRNEK